MRNKTYHRIETIPKSNIKIVERGKIDTIKNKYMTAHFPGLEQALE